MQLDKQSCARSAAHTGGQPADQSSAQLSGDSGGWSYHGQQNIPASQPSGDSGVWPYGAQEGPSGGRTCGGQEGQPSARPADQSGVRSYHGQEGIPAGQSSAQPSGDSGGWPYGGQTCGAQEGPSGGRTCGGPEDLFELRPSPIGDLTFERMGSDPLLDAAMDASLPLFFRGGKPTNLALLFSEQNPYLVEVGFFKGRDRTAIAGRQVFKGPIPLQLEKVQALLLKGGGAQRPDYPPAAVREALANCLCHRDYTIRGSIQIAVFEDRIELANFGGLEDGLSVDEIAKGVAHPRNPVLASFLYSINLCDGFGTGAGKILAPYAKDRIRPRFESLGGVFRAVLPNRNATEEGKRERGYFVSEKDQILSYAREQGFVTRREVEELLESGPTKAYLVLRQLREDGFVKSQGKGRNSAYLPV